MEWKCPDCGKTNNEDVKKCACNYAFYEVLGVKSDATEETVKQSYKYLVNVWRPQALSTDAETKKKAQERLKKINSAYNVFKQYSSNFSGARKRAYYIKISIGTVVGLIIIILVFTNIFEQDKTGNQILPKFDDKTKQKPSAPNQITDRNISVTSPDLDDSAKNKEGVAPSPDSTSSSSSTEKTEDWAIESVKKAHFSGSGSSIESLINKWSKDNADKYKAIGWQAKKMDDQTYLVSYTVTDGLATTGFYFDINTDSVTIRNLADYPDLRQKYGIRYNQ